MSADGHDPSVSDEFTSVENNVDKLLAELARRGVDSLDAFYGLSMGGAMALRLLSVGNIKIGKAILDAAITPYPYPKWICKLILLKDFLCVHAIVRHPWLLEKIFQPERFAVKGHDTRAEYDALELFYKTYSNRTIKNVFWSANNYELPKQGNSTGTEILYWCAEKEVRARKEDMKFVKKFLPCARFKFLPGYNHGELMCCTRRNFTARLWSFSGPESTDLNCPAAFCMQEF